MNTIRQFLDTVNSPTVPGGRTAPGSRRCRADDVGDLRGQPRVSDELGRLQRRGVPPTSPSLGHRQTERFQLLGQNPGDQWVIPNLFGGGVNVSAMIVLWSTVRGRIWGALAGLA